MGKGRLEAFSEDVLVILITMMVLEMKVPCVATPGPLSAPASVDMALGVCLYRLQMMLTLSSAYQQEADDDYDAGDASAEQ